MTQKKIRKAVIPAAGLGTRFLPATKAIPKEMIPILDKPMIQFIVEEAVQSGIETIVLVTARHKEMIENHFDYNYELDDTLAKRSKDELLEASRQVSELCDVVSIRQKNPLGLGHAVLTAQPVIGDEPFAVLLGDDLIDAPGNPCTRQLTNIFEERDQSVVGVMKVAPDQVSKYGIVGGKEISSRLMQVNRLIEKPKPEDAPSQYAIPGRYVLSAKIFDYLRETRPGAGGEIQLTDGLELLAKNEGLLSYEFEGDRYDTGDRLGYLDATLNFSLRRPDLKDGLISIMNRHLGNSK